MNKIVFCTMLFSLLASELIQTSEKSTSPKDSQPLLRRHKGPGERLTSPTKQGQPSHNDRIKSPEIPFVLGKRNRSPENQKN